eukprot:TRINITY_DN18526_c0_g1_i3.p1 TRINITY_DN18526_c0_g1~~TRINITY_DN18526_c0_g1_i3.p1  ORF type:complete len:256 (+),score=32.53 TRINITY_DN18526_c0_g1_i3:342-1109(+)
MSSLGEQMAQLSRPVWALIFGRSGRSGTCLCAGTCREFLEVIATEPIVFASLLFKLGSPFDTNGVLYYLGTGCGMHEYQNPHTVEQVTVSRSSVFGCCRLEHFVDHHDFGDELNVTANKPKSWMAVDLGEGRLLAIHHYCLRHGGNGHCLRQWELQGSVDASEWHTLRRHGDEFEPEHDQALDSILDCPENDPEYLVDEPGAVCAWAIENRDDDTQWYRHFRILQWGRNATSHDYLKCTGFELYGEFMDCQDVLG